MTLKSNLDEPFDTDFGQFDLHRQVDFFSRRVVEENIT